MVSIPDPFDVRLVRTEDELRAAQRLRYEVFVEELGGDGPLVDHAQRLERDRFDDHADHLILTDRRQEDRVVGVYRLMRGDRRAAQHGFYCESEYDLAPLLGSGRKLLELGRSCLAPSCRGGAGVFRMWSALADYVERHGIELLFGVASFHGTDAAAFAPSLSLLHHRHLAPAPLRVRARPEGYQAMDLIAPEALDRRRAMLDMPPIIKAYLRLGGKVGEGAFVDRAFNTTDICMILDAAEMDAARRRLYTQGAAGG